MKAPATASPGSRDPAPERASLVVSDLSLALNGKIILEALSFELPARGMNVLIGPSGAGKSTLLKCINQLHKGWEGGIHVLGCDARRWPGGGDALRRSVGLIAQKPVVFPGSIEKNVCFGLCGRTRRRPNAEIVGRSLRRAALWDEIKDRLQDPACSLSVGQQQRLCLARALILEPAMLLLDEPTSSLDPRSKQLLERSLLRLASSMPILWVTHDIEQARRLGGNLIFMCAGRIIESGPSAEILTRPRRLETREFLRWSTCDCGDIP